MTDTFNEMYDAFGLRPSGHQHFYQWLRFYQSFGIEVDYESIEVPNRPDETYLPILNLESVDPDEVSRLFRSRLQWYQMVGFVGPVTRGKSGQEVEDWVTTSFRDITGPDERTSDDGSYVFWVKDHVEVKKSGRLKYTPFDERMTVTEALLYHLYQIQRHGRAYFDLHYDWVHFCDGSRGRNALRWDMQDIKICLDSSSRYGR